MPKAGIKECTTQRLCSLSVKAASDHSMLTIEPPSVAPEPANLQPHPHDERGKHGWCAVTLSSKRPASWKSPGMPTRQSKTGRDLEVLVNARLVTGLGTGLACTKPLGDWQAFC